MPKYVIERDLPGAGALTADEVNTVTAKSKEVLLAMAPRAQWLHSYVTGDKVYCVYVAEDEDAIHEHGDRSGLPVTAIHEVVSVVDPATGDRRA